VTQKQTGRLTSHAPQESFSGFCFRSIRFYPSAHLYPSPSFYVSTSFRLPIRLRLCVNHPRPQIHGKVRESIEALPREKIPGDTHRAATHTDPLSSLSRRVIAVREGGNGNRDHTRSEAGFRDT
jgi:hypothetical protein